MHRYRSLYPMTEEQFLGERAETVSRALVLADVEGEVAAKRMPPVVGDSG